MGPSRRSSCSGAGGVFSLGCTGAATKGVAVRRCSDTAAGGVFAFVSAGDGAGGVVVWRWAGTGGFGNNGFEPLATINAIGFTREWRGGRRFEAKAGRWWSGFSLSNFSNSFSCSGQKRFSFVLSLLTLSHRLIKLHRNREMLNSAFKSGTSRHSLAALSKVLLS